MDIVNIYDNYNSYFNADLKAIFERCSKIASKSGFRLYLIGGVVRDMLLSNNVFARNEMTKQSNQRTNIGKIASSGINVTSPSCNNIKFLDIDITIEGDAIKFAHILKKEINAKILSIHKDFGTVKVKIDENEIDFASTRSESYPRAGHLPHVDEIGCLLEKDIRRRDFTINSLALSLNKDSFADLIDYVKGFEDLKNKKIRILHDKSFIDDPTRIIRALKYSTRFGFDLDEKTVRLQKEYLAKINYDMCYKRVKQEIKKTFEQNIQEAFDRFIDEKIYKLIIKNSVQKPLINIEPLINIYPPKYVWLVYFGVIALGQNIDIFSFTKYEQEVLKSAESLVNKKFKGDFELYKTFGGKYLESLLILAILGKEKEVYHYLDNLKDIKLDINGKDLIKLGFKPSKDFSKIFDFVLKEKLKNPALNKTGEIEFAKTCLN